MLKVRLTSGHIALLSALILAGCQSGVERDIVQRELRQQEDQIYAMEDYLAEYQQLLCEARNENAMLKRQMVQGQFRDRGPRQQSDSILPSPPDRPPTRPGETPPVDTPQPPPLDVSEPAVPPLNDATSNTPNEEPTDRVQLAAAEIELPAQHASAVGVQGEVLLDAESGPRVLAKVEALTPVGKPAKFQGSLSLLVLDPTASDDEKQLARWDFAANELRSVTSDAGGYEFPLQLPAASPTNRPLELWVRLKPEDGNKLLGRTTLDLSRSGRFGSAGAKPIKVESKVIQAAAVEQQTSMGRRKPLLDAVAGIRRSGWQTARPGEIAQSTSGTSSSTSEWRTASQPIPIVESVPVAKSTPVHGYMATSNHDDRYEATTPEWSPLRNGDAKVKLPPLNHIVPPPSPGWAPTR